jgi:hypothetical protein
VGYKSVVVRVAENGRIGRDTFVEQTPLETEMRVVHGRRCLRLAL